MAAAADSTLTRHEPARHEPIGDDYGSAPVSGRLLRRTAVVYVALLALGLLPVFVHAPASFQAAGLGLLFPGGGFLAIGGWGYLLFVGSLLLMLIAIALMLLTANVAAPLLIWLGSALLSATLAAGGIVPSAPFTVLALVLAFVVWAAYTHRATLQREMAHRALRNAYLPLAERQVLERAAPRATPGTRELTAEDLAHLRFALDRGLQPAESLEGFDVIEQFQTSSLRYQINNLLWALQIAQCHYTPNFHGYLSQAQRNLIDKLTVPKVWKWWRWESLWGNFSLKADPIAKDNIMFGGFSSAHIALYTANTGDDRYLQPGSLSFRLNRFRTYRHDLHTILSAGRRNHQIAVYAPLYPCEPKLTYSACNLQGNFAHLVADRIFGTNARQELVERLRPMHVTEMLCRDGVVHAGRVTPLGIRIPVYTSNQVEALWGWMASAFFPDLSQRVWATLRHEHLSFDASGGITIATKSYDRMDMGNYRKSEAGPYTQFLVLAREQGDDEVADAILRKLDREYERLESNGTVSYGKASIYNMAYMIMGRIMRTGDVRHMILDGPPSSALSGPVLTGATYPDVLVAKAFSDGADLNLVLYPGGPSSRQRLRVERLHPGRAYAVVSGEERGSVVADADGCASIDVWLGEGRTEVRLADVGSG